jgi:hypothetical protein
MEVLRTLHAQQLRHYTENKAGAKSVAGAEDPALAAMTILCSTLLTSDAAITNR